MIEIQFGVVVLLICNTAFADGASVLSPRSQFSVWGQALGEGGGDQAPRAGSLGVWRDAKLQPPPVTFAALQFPQGSRLRGCTYPSYHVFFLPNYVAQIGNYHNLSLLPQFVNFFVAS